MNFANIFVLCTGRCGSTTIVKAMEHATNFTAGHETRRHLIGDQRLAYPAGHFEADNRLSWFLGRLDAKFGTAPLYVHLTRDPGAVAKSFAARPSMGIMKAYREEIVRGGRGRTQKGWGIEEFALDMVDTVTSNIQHFLRDKPNTMHFRLEDAEADFQTLWNRIGASGDFPAATAEWQTRHNATVVAA